MIGHTIARPAALDLVEFPSNALSTNRYDDLPDLRSGASPLRPPAGSVALSRLSVSNATNPLLAARAWERPGVADHRAFLSRQCRSSGGNPRLLSVVELQPLI